MWLVCFDPDTKEWAWPTCTGATPSPRAAHSVFVHEDKAYVFGGRLLSKRLNDMYSLDLNTFNWSHVRHKTAENKLEPKGRSWHSFTVMGDDHALLYGGMDTDNQILADCWLFHVPTSTFKACNFDRGPLLWHRAVVESNTGSLWLIGGLRTNIFAQD